MPVVCLGAFHQSFLCPCRFSCNVVFSELLLLSLWRPFGSIVVNCGYCYSKYPTVYKTYMLYEPLLFLYDVFLISLFLTNYKVVVLFSVMSNYFYYNCINYFFECYCRFPCVVVYTNLCSFMPCLCRLSCYTIYMSLWFSQTRRCFVISQHYFQNILIYISYIYIKNHVQNALKHAPSLLPTFFLLSKYWYPVLNFSNL